MKVPMSTKVKERYVFNSMHTPCLLRESFHGFCPQWFLFYFSPVDFHHVSRKRIFMDLPSVVSFLFLPSGFSPCLLRENFHGFCPQWFLFYFSPVDFHYVSSERTFMDFALSGFFSIFPQQIFIVSFQEGTTDFAFSSFIFSFPRGFSPCLFRKNNHGLLPSVVFDFHPQWILCLLKENFHEFYPQWFSLYF